MFFKGPCYTVGGLFGFSLQHCNCFSSCHKGTSFNRNTAELRVLAGFNVCTTKPEHYACYIKNLGLFRWKLNWTSVWGHNCECVSYNSRFKGRFDFSLLQQDPVDLSEEGMGLDGLFAALAHHAAQTLGRVLGHELHTSTRTQITHRFRPATLEPLWDAWLQFHP